MSRAKRAAIVATIVLLSIGAYAQKAQSFTVTLASTDISLATFNFPGMPPGANNPCANQTAAANALSITVVGNMKRLGVVSGTQTLCTYPGDVAGDGSMPFDGVFTVTNGKGDTLSGSYSGSVDASGVMRGSLKLTGGTGKCAQATGSGTIVAVQTMNQYGITSDVSTILQGEMTAAGKGK